MKRKLVIAALISFAIAVPSFASVISFQVVQHDVSQDKIRTSSYQIEGALMDFFFDQGYIVTNSPTIVSSNKESDDAAYGKAVNEAIDGRCDYFIAVYAEYDVKGSEAPEMSLLSNIKSISWTAYNVITGKKIASGAEKTGTVDPADDTDLGVANFAKKIAQQINSSLKSK